jgi:Zn-dependent protease
VMTVILPAVLILSHAPFVFGSAKPVPVNPRNYRNYVRGDIIVSLAGIATNLVLFLLSAIAFSLVGLLAHAIGSTATSLELLQRMFFWARYLNLVLACFNLIPIPPLDGSHVLKQILPPAAGMRYRQLYALGIIPILVVMWLLPGVINVFMWPGIKLMGVALRLVYPLALPEGLPPWILS